MVWRIVVFVSSACLAVLTLRDVFHTVIVPGESRGILRVARRMLFFSLPLWKAARGRRGGLPTGFAPFVLVGSFAIWMLLLILGFAGMLDALAESFRPPLTGIGQAVYVAGSGIITMGLSGTIAEGPARWILLLSGFCGLGVMTLAITYLLEVQSGVTERDTGILKLNTSSGDPPAALTSLEYHAAIGCHDVLPELMRGGRNWCAAVGQSHASHPSLIYFRSVGIGAGWPAALGTFLDLALITELLLNDAHAHGAAVLLGQEAKSMAQKLMNLIGLKPKDVATEPREAAQIAQRLREAGYPINEYDNWGEFAKRRDQYFRCVAALAEHLGGPASPLLPGADVVQP